MTSLIHTAVTGPVATLTLDSPHNRNALSTALIEELLAALAAANADPAARVIVLDHTGPVFSSGADLKETAAAASGPPGTQPEPGSGGGEHGRRGTPGTQPEPVSGGGEHGRRGSSIPVGRLGEVLA
ncbi:MAG: methylglutaconyl-CoA hydratase, partial [Micromonosporaceae bacterium]